MKYSNPIFLLIPTLLFIITSCNPSTKENKGNLIPVIGFIDFVQDETLAKAKKGFMDALAKEGYSEDKKNIEVIYKNAQGDQPTLLQSIDLLISKKPIFLISF